MLEEAVEIAAGNIQTLLQYKSLNDQSILGASVIGRNIFSRMSVEEITDLVKNFLINKKYHPLLNKMLIPFDQYWMERLEPSVYHYSYAEDHLNPLKNKEQIGLLQRTQRHFRTKKLTEKRGVCCEVDIYGGKELGYKRSAPHDIELGNCYCILYYKPDVLKLFQFRPSCHLISTHRNPLHDTNPRHPRNAPVLSHRLLEPFLISIAGPTGYTCKYIPSSGTAGTLLSLPNVEFINMFTGTKVVYQFVT